LNVPFFPSILIILAIELVGLLTYMLIINRLIRYNNSIIKQIIIDMPS
jgi:hypothetical protein